MFSVSGNMKQRDVYFQKKKKRIELNKEKKTKKEKDRRGGRG